MIGVSRRDERNHVLRALHSSRLDIIAFVQGSNAIEWVVRSMLTNAS